LARNVWGGFFDLARGLFPFSPFLVVLIPGVPAGWRAAPHWVRGAALGGFAYFMLQLAWNRFSGGSGFWGYRYPIEMLVAVTPLMTLSYVEWVRKRPVATRMLVVALAVSVGLHAAGAVRCARYLC
jgi:alpha-1,2-mannosyltransferase